MAFDSFLKLEGLDGEATRAGFEKWIELFSFSWGASNPVTIGPGTTGAGGGRVSISSFNCMKKTDCASPVLFQMCCNGKHFPTAKLMLNKAGGDDQKAVEYISYEFSLVFVESVQWSGSTGGDDSPTESVSFAFGGVQINYTPQSATGTPGTPIRGSWDVTKTAAK
jgi:type VI secretion system secreted protein Hcp